MKNGFVYKWINQKTGMVYVGRHQGFVDDGYIASSEDFMTAYEIDKKNWKREILFAGDYEQVKKQESVFIKKAVKEHGVNCVFNKCSSTKSSNDYNSMSQGKLYGLRKNIEQEIKELQVRLEQLRADKIEIDLTLKKFSIKGRESKI